MYMARKERKENEKVNNEDSEIFINVRIDN